MTNFILKVLPQEKVLITSLSYTYNGVHFCKKNDGYPRLAANNVCFLSLSESLDPPLPPSSQWKRVITIVVVVFLSPGAPTRTTHAVVLLLLLARGADTDWNYRARRPVNDNLHRTMNGPRRSSDSPRPGRELIRADEAGPGKRRGRGLPSVLGQHRRRSAPGQV